MYNPFEEVDGRRRRFAGRGYWESRMGGDGYLSVFGLQYGLFRTPMLSIAAVVLTTIASYALSTLPTSLVVHAAWLLWAIVALAASALAVVSFVMAGIYTVSHRGSLERDVLVLAVAIADLTVLRILAWTGVVVAASLYDPSVTTVPALGIGGLTRTFRYVAGTIYLVAGDTLGMASPDYMIVSPLLQTVAVCHTIVDYIVNLAVVGVVVGMFVSNIGGDREAVSPPPSNTDPMSKALHHGTHGQPQASESCGYAMQVIGDTVTTA